ncbi:MAG: PAS domain-containing protein [Mycobacteriales bacterium]
MDLVSSPSASGIAPTQFLAALVNSSDDAIVGLTPDGTVVSWNGAAERIFGYRAQEMIGRDAAALLPPDRHGEVSGWLARVRQGETVRNVSTRRLRKDGASIAVSVTMSPVLGADGALVGVSAIGRDMTADGEAIERLRDARRSAVEALTLLQTLQDNAPVGIGFVDREFRVLRLNKMLGTFIDPSGQDKIDRPAAEVIPSLWPQVEPLFRHVLETGQAVVNTEVSWEIPAEPGEPHHWLASYYPISIDGQIVGVGVVSVDITERKRVEEAHGRLTHAAVGALVATVEARDPYTSGHQERVAVIASAIAVDLGLDSGAVEGIELAALIHDIGKIAIPVEILSRPGRLNAPSWELMKTHASAGADIMRGFDFPWPVADMVEQHHERLDGTGYPSGMRGEEILLEARIIAVADTVEAMVSHRPYRAGASIEAALEEVSRGRGRLFEPAVVDACLRLFREQGLKLDW